MVSPGLTGEDFRQRYPVFEAAVQPLFTSERHLHEAHLPSRIPGDRRCPGARRLRRRDDPLSSDNGDKGNGTTIRVGSANFPESVLLAEIYAEALEDKGFNVEKTLNIGSRETYIQR